MYKKILTTIMLAVITGTNAQVIIGGVNGTAANKTSVLLEFEAGQNKGIIVPYVRTLPTGGALVGGTIILDATTPAAARMKYYNAVTSAWVDLSGSGANSLSGDLTGANLLPKQPTEAQAPESATSKAIIGASSSTADGVLVLESDTKAMVLPTVSDVQNIPSPSPGMMVYVNKPGAKRFAVYNGSIWSYWKP